MCTEKENKKYSGVLRGCLGELGGVVGVFEGVGGGLEVLRGCLEEFGGVKGVFVRVWRA